MLTEADRSCLRASFRKASVEANLPGDLAAAIASETHLPLRKVECFALECGAVPNRYSRNVGTVGLDGQRRLLGACVVVVGMGGLGGHVVEALARLGVGRIVGADGDVFTEGNLNRQLLCEVGNLGASKVAQAAARVARVNPAVEFVAHAEPFQTLDDEALAACDLVFDCLDSIPARGELARRCEHAGVVLVHGAIAGWSGQVGLCTPGSGMLEKIYEGEKRGAEKQLGNLPFTAAVAANLMVAEGVRLLLGEPVPDGRRLQFFDLLGGDWETIEL